MSTKLPKKMNLCTDLKLHLCALKVQLKASHATKTLTHTKHDTDQFQARTLHSFFNISPPLRAAPYPPEQKPVPDYFGDGGKSMDKSII